MTMKITRGPTYEVGFDLAQGRYGVYAQMWFRCLRPGCEARGRKSYAEGDWRHLYCSVCGFHERSKDGHDSR